MKFCLYDAAHDVLFGDQLQVHLVELKKYNEVWVKASELGSLSLLEKWVLLMTEASDREAAELRQLLPGVPFQKAIDILEMITRSPELRLVYDDRAKEAQDNIALRQDSLAEGKAEGKLLGQIQLLQQLLSLSSPSELELGEMSLSELESLVDSLRSKLSENS